MAALRLLVSSALILGCARPVATSSNAPVEPVLAPTQVLAETNRLLASKRAEDIERARILLEGCVARFADSADCWRALSVALVRCGDRRSREQAVAAYKRYLDLVPLDSGTVHTPAAVDWPWQAPDQPNP